MATTIGMTERADASGDLAEATSLLTQVEQSGRARKTQARRLMRLAGQVRSAATPTRELLPDLFACAAAEGFALWLLKVAGGQAIKDVLGRRGLRSQVRSLQKALQERARRTC